MCIRDRNRPYDMEEPNFFGLSIAYDPYMREVVQADRPVSYTHLEFLDAEQITKNKLYIYTREKNTGFDRRFLMKRVGEGWMIDGVQERLDGWQRTGL